MRCPKCGYISFDRQKSCGKCSHDLTAVAEQLQGTVIKAEAPFFLAAALGKKIPAAAEPAPALEEDEALALDELVAEAPAADEEELDFAGAPLDEDDLAEQTLPSLGLEDIDVSDLMPPQAEEEEPVLSLESGQEEALPTPPAPAPAREEEEDSLMGIEPSSHAPEESLNLYEQESLFGGLEEAAEPSAEAEEEEIIDLSALMDFEETPAPPAAQEEKPEILELSLEDGEDVPAPAEATQKPASTVADIPDLGLTLENDDR
jgi:hypothetical protein